jgi:hypothetical protein
MNRKKLNQICDKILNGQSWQYCKFGEWIIGDGLSPRYCVQQGHEIRLTPLPIKSCENCKNYKSGVNLHDENLELGFCIILQRQKYNNEGAKCAKFEDE